MRSKLTYRILRLACITSITNNFLKWSECFVLWLLVWGMGLIIHPSQSVFFWNLRLVIRIKIWRIFICVWMCSILKYFVTWVFFPYSLSLFLFFFFNLKLQKENPKRKHRPVCNTFIHKFLFYLALQPSYNLCSLYPLKYFHFLTLNILSSVY